MNDEQVWEEIKRQSLLSDVDLEGTLSAETMRVTAAKRFKGIVRAMAYTNWPIVAPDTYSEPLFVYVIEIAQYGEAGILTLQNTVSAMKYISETLCRIYDDTSKKTLYCEIALIHLKEQFPLLKIQHYTIPNIQT